MGAIIVARYLRWQKSFLQCGYSSGQSEFNRHFTKVEVFKSKVNQINKTIKVRISYLFYSSDTKIINILLLQIFRVSLYMFPSVLRLKNTFPESSS